jgi:predicted metal-dependent TIM-barrel fold hydrolase
MKRISELTKEFEKKLQEIAEGAKWGHFRQTERGREIIRGEHITVTVPRGVDFNPKQVEALFNLLYDDVTMAYCKDETINSVDVVEIMLDVDSDERNETLRKGLKLIEEGK